MENSIQGKANQENNQEIRELAAEEAEHVAGGTDPEVEVGSGGGKS